MEGIKDSIVNIETEPGEVSPTKDILSSKAVSSAMKALQSKIRVLESENTSLKLQCEDLKTSYEKRVDILNHRLEDTFQALNKAREEAGVFESKFNQIIDENKLLVEELDTEKERFTGKINGLLNELELIKSSENEEKVKLRAKLKDLNEITLEVTEQLESNSKKLENSRAYYEDICSTYEHDLENLKSTIDALERNNEELRQQVLNKDKDTRYLKDKIEEITQINEQDRNKLIQQCNEAQDFIFQISNKLVKNQHRRTARRKKLLRVKSENTNKKVDSQINNREGEISHSNLRYPSALHQSYNELEGSLGVKSQLYKIARKIEENNTCIKKLKQKHKV